MEKEYEQEKAEQSMKRNAIVFMVAVLAILVVSYVAILIVK